MSRPSPSNALALKAASMLSDLDTDEVAEATEVATTDAPAPKKRGRPPGKRREVSVSFALRLDEERHKALQVMADSMGVSIHGLILMGIDAITEKPRVKIWESRS